MINWIQNKIMKNQHTDKVRQYISQETIIDQIVDRWRWNLRMVHDLIMSHGIDNIRAHRYLLNKHGITIATFK